MKKNQIIKTSFRKFESFGRLYSLLAILLFLISSTAFCQSLSVFDLDVSSFPTIKAKFFAFDKDGNQITNLNTSDFEVKENGQPRNVTYVSCTAPKTEHLSIVFAVDVTIYNNIYNAKSVLNAWLDIIPLNKNEIAIMSYDGNSYINQDFTTDKIKLQRSINSLTTLSGSEDHTGALIRPVTGAISVAKQGKYKPIVIVLSSCSHFSATRESSIIEEAKKYNVTINFNIFDRYDWTPEICRNISKETGGFSNNHIPYNDLNTAIKSIQIILAVNKNDPCVIHWQSGVSCTAGITNIELTLLQNGTKATTSYQSPNSSTAQLEFNPTTLKFVDPQVGVKTERKVTVTARNTNFTATNITSNNAGFDITPKSFVLNSGQSRELTVSYTPADSGYNYCKFEIQNDICLTKYYASGGWKGKKPTIRTLKLIHPNGGEVFVAGSDTVITWEGVSPDEPVKLEYRTDDNQPWVTVTDTAKGLSCPFRVPRIVSKKYLARVTAAAKTSSYCDNPDVEICGKIWMGCNLDVDTYRNGDPIPEVTNATQWANLKTGAWCYYNNDPVNSEIYGKLYNWYAVNDPRGLAPDGWHIPTDSEWTELENCLGGSSVAGGKLKSTGTIEGGDGLWVSPNAGATNEIGFSALPGGYRKDNGAFDAVGGYGGWWSATEYGATAAWDRYLCYNYPSIIRGSNYKESGFSVRCVMD